MRSVQTFVVDQSYNEPNITHTDWFGRNSIRFKPWDNFRNATNTTKVRRTIRYYDRFQFKRKSKTARHDEPELAAFVYANSFNLIEEYLVGPPRHPFYKPRGNYILSVTEALQNDWMESAASILDKLWRDYRVLNVLIMMPCEINQQVIGFLDPFDPDPDPTVDHKLKDNWGAIKWMELDDLDLESGWLLMKGRNFKGYPFKASTFRRYPTMVESSTLPKTFLNTFYANGAKYSGGLAGFDGLVLGNLAQVHNFRTIRVASISYGALLSDNSFSGSMGDILYRYADASFNGRFIIDYGSNEIEFLHPVFADKFCVIAPSALQIPGWMAIFRCYSAEVWVGILMTVFICTGYWHFIRKAEIKLNGKFGVGKSFKINIAFTDMVMLITGGPIHSKPFRVLERIFIGSCLIFNIIIAGTFQGSLTTSFSTTAYEPEIDTLEQLDRSGLPIVSSANTIKNFFGTDNNTVGLLMSDILQFCRIRKKQRKVRTWVVSDGRISCRQMIVIIIKTFLGLLMKWYNEIENALIAQKAAKKESDG
ncbi:hypothetical protein Bhyg_01434 [Pseudolycoriella hygida]|uniref:Ionotropic glutamate receptor C-terminal domain-containing protein n=1 Tax=Pseudolycoriella hygida TaxID=35572 RepID=A0A9Q0S6V0_9DIPT|nr:hypothetical protein Bhyg_01434 [Pseudolycoriella hygida]